MIHIKKHGGSQFIWAQRNHYAEDVRAKQHPSLTVNGGAMECLKEAENVRGKVC